MKTVFTFILAALALSTLVACSKLTQENYQNIKVGMSQTEVTSIIGAPTSCDEGFAAKSCIWGNENRNIKVKFAADIALSVTGKGLK